MKGRLYFAILGFAVGAYLGSSTGVASGGSAQNGWFIFGLVGAALCFILTFTIHTPSKNSKIGPDANQNEPTDSSRLNKFSSLHEVGEGISSQMEGLEGIDLEVELYSFFLKNPLAVRSFAAEEIQSVVRYPVSLREIEKSLALLRRMKGR